MGFLAKHDLAKNIFFLFLKGHCRAAKKTAGFVGLWGRFGFKACGSRKLPYAFHMGLNA